MRRIAVVGGGIAGVTAAYELAKLARAGVEIEATLFEASPRLGGIVETHREGGFVIECGPDGWVSEKPWARELAVELGLGDELLPSNDAARKTHILLEGRLQAMPDGMRMMVPRDLASLKGSTVLSEEAKRSYALELERAEELRRSAPASDESVASFVRRHFGEEVLRTLGAPLLSGVFGGNVETLSVRAVMGPFVAMQREHGSLIAALQSRSGTPGASLFTTLRSGLGTLVDRMVATVPAEWVRRNTAVSSIERWETGWRVGLKGNGTREFDAVMLAAPVDEARRMMMPLDSEAAALMQMESSSAVVVAFAFAGDFKLPEGFGFLAPEGSGSRLLACTFVDQKFAERVPEGGRLLRAFFGGTAAERMTRCGNDEVAAIARMELARVLGPLPDAQLTVVRRWPRSLPQYGVGHLERMAALQERVAALKGLHLLGNGYRGVGLPDLVRDARAAVRETAVRSG